MLEDLGVWGSVGEFRYTVPLGGRNGEDVPFGWGLGDYFDLVPLGGEGIRCLCTEIDRALILFQVEGFLADG